MIHKRGSIKQHYFSSTFLKAILMAYGHVNETETLAVQAVQWLVVCSGLENKMLTKMYKQHAQHIAKYMAKIFLFFPAYQCQMCKVVGICKATLHIL